MNGLDDERYIRGRRFSVDDYVSRETATNVAIEAVDDWDGGYNLSRQLIIENAMSKIPAADVLPVVRCRDCKHWMRKREMPNTLPRQCECDVISNWSNAYFTQEYGYCHRGERQIEQQNEC